MTTTPLPLLHARDLPATGGQLWSATAAVHALTAEHGSATTRAEYVRLRRLLAPERHEPAPDRNEPAPPRETPALEEAFSEHDAFFGVARSHGPADVFLRTLLIAEIDTALDLAGTSSSLGPTERSRLVGGGSALLSHARHPDDGDLVRPPDVRAARPPDARTARLRWACGHRLFFAHLQAFTVTAACAAEAACATEQATFLDHTVLFCQNAALAMRHAADFAPDLYARSVRPTMTPPRVGSGFSGLQTRDHYYLVRSLDRLRTRVLPDPAATAAYDRLADALELLYGAHVHVCRHFGGDTGPSLRMEAGEEDSGTTGAERARQYAALRVRKVRSACPAKRAA
ncbi:hypothetical protein AB0O42_08190 [Streptomyces sp. NPDC089922]|uniref:hypothetical protein n=1 Tax=unclassified Streptomyces TaxID=2593676 RepID=UPI00342FCB84